MKINPKFRFAATFLLVLALLYVPVHAEAEPLSIEVQMSKTTVVSGDIVEITVLLGNYSDSAVPDISAMQINVNTNGRYTSYEDGSAEPQTKSTDSDMNLINFSKRDSDGQLIYLCTPLAGVSRDERELFSFKIRVNDSLPVGASVDIPMEIEVFGDHADEYRSLAFTAPTIRLMRVSDTITTQTSPQGGGEVIVDIDEKDDLPWDSVEIIVPGDSEVTTQKIEGGVLITGDNLKGVEVTVVKDGQSHKITIDSDAPGVVIREENGQPVVDEGVLENTPVTSAVASGTTADNVGETAPARKIPWANIVAVAAICAVAAVVLVVVVKVARRK